MTRATLARLWSELALRHRRSVQEWLSLRTARTGPRLRAALAQASAVAASLLILMIDGAAGVVGDEVLVWIAIVLGFGALRVATAGRRLATSTIVLDAIGTAVFLAGTGGPSSPFLLLALAGVWWSADVGRGLSAQVYRIDRRYSELRVAPDSVVEVTGRRRSWLVYGLAFIGAYAVLALPEAARGTTELPEAFEDLAIFAIVAVLSEWFGRSERRETERSRPIRVRAPGAEQLPIREGLARALRGDAAIDAVLAAGQAGLTAIQAELLAYLVLGLTNLEIADAMQVSEATVRYRLTRLYRDLGVMNRRGARERALELGITRSSAPPRC